MPAWPLLEHKTKRPPHIELSMWRPLSGSVLKSQGVWKTNPDATGRVLARLTLSSAKICAGMHIVFG
ncbi:hypothetical protein Plim_2020 [Planctopirus limnophila DSM 3776]|uniref:Uncharacterized protein n=1 Tax=Planctopirus limnophila (strain ATCC 43296 / DSM 3776 / IFAM 1008 / Mu 290) TaxID=521674 RepID=D5SYR6_PLAL2|nr:hypothetical protein Plim_2020 [Planctopirus limnophila DSM 3776]